MCSLLQRTISDLSYSPRSNECQRVLDHLALISLLIAISSSISVKDFNFRFLLERPKRTPNQRLRFFHTGLSGISTSVGVAGPFVWVDWKFQTWSSHVVQHVTLLECHFLELHLMDSQTTVLDYFLVHWFPVYTFLLGKLHTRNIIDRETLKVIWLTSSVKPSKKLVDVDSQVLLHGHSLQLQSIDIQLPHV